MISKKQEYDRRKQMTNDGNEWQGTLKVGEEEEILLCVQLCRNFFCGSIDGCRCLVHCQTSLVHCQTSQDDTLSLMPTVNGDPYFVNRKTATSLQLVSIFFVLLGSRISYDVRSTIFSIRLLFCFPLARTLLSSRPRWMILGLSGKIAMIIDENVFTVNMQLCKSMQKRYGVSIQNNESNSCTRFVPEIIIIEQSIHHIFKVRGYWFAAVLGTESFGEV